MKIKSFLNKKIIIFFILFFSLLSFINFIPPDTNEIIFGFLFLFFLTLIIFLSIFFKKATSIILGLSATFFLFLKFFNILDLFNFFVLLSITTISVLFLKMK